MLTPITKIKSKNPKYFKHENVNHKLKPKNFKLKNPNPKPQKIKPKTIKFEH